MRLKPLPPVPDAGLDAVAAAQQAVPLVPGSENDCCARLMRRRGFESRDVARTWLTFLRALELAEGTDSGFKRTDRDPTPENVRASFLNRVYGAEEALTALRDTEEPLPPAAAFERLRGTVPGWERHKQRGWEDAWEERVGDLLDWLVLLGLAERTDDGYIAADERSS
ncbi:MAG: hypothetical protein ABEH90_07540 [Halolamina sp.]